MFSSVAGSRPGHARNVTGRLQDATRRDQRARPRRQHQAHEGAPGPGDRPAPPRAGRAVLSPTALGFTMAPMDGAPTDRDLAAIGLLQDPVRRALYEHVVAAGGEVSRNQAAQAAAVGRGLAAFHPY